MRVSKQFFLSEGIYIALGIERPKEAEKFYYDNTPMITMHSESDYIAFSVITDEDNTSRQILMTPKQAKEISKILKKLAKKVKRK